MPRVDPYRGCNFLVEIDGITQAGFSEITGLGADTAPTEYREGNETLTPRQLPSLTKYSNIELKYGLTDNSELFDWYTDITKGKIDRRNGSIVVLDTDGTTEKVRWNFYDAWPSKFTAPTFNAAQGAVAVTGMTLVTERVELGT
jgi:phage tail-like protein